MNKHENADGDGAALFSAHLENLAAFNAAAVTGRFRSRSPVQKKKSASVTVTKPVTVRDRSRSHNRSWQLHERARKSAQRTYWVLAETARH